MMRQWWTARGRASKGVMGQHGDDFLSGASGQGVCLPKKPVMYNLEDLAALAPPPKAVVNPGTLAQWKSVKEAINQELPLDWLHYSLRYGSGSFVSGPFHFSLNNVFAPLFVEGFEFHRHVNRSAFARGSLDLSEAKDFVELGGFAFDYDDQGDEGGLWWLPVGPPDKWPIFARAGCAAFERFDMPLFAFLVGAIRSEIRVNHFPSTFADLQFIPTLRATRAYGPRNDP